VEKAGYEISFSFNTGTAILGSKINRFAIPRLSAPFSFSEFRALLSFPQLMDYNSVKSKID
jgi:hypothetical protein